MSLRHSENPAVKAAQYAAVAAIAFAIGLVEGAKVRECPPFTPDGRPLQGRDLGKNTCSYQPLPRPALELSPTELRRMAKLRETLR